MVRRIFVEKIQDVEAADMMADLKENLGIAGLSKVRLVKRYDISGITDEEYAAARTTILSEPQVDICYDEDFPKEDADKIFAMEYLPGQYDQRADSAAQCIQILTAGDKPQVKTATVILLYGDVSEDEFEKIQKYIINPVEAQRASMEKPATLDMETVVPDDVKTVDGFTEMDDADLKAMLNTLGLAMDLDDLRFCRDYFKTENRQPSLTEIRMIDTYWSDHCRHTTFSTKLENVLIEDAVIKKVYDEYIKNRKEYYGERKKDITFMDMATIAGKELRKAGYLKNIDVSEEINACSIVVPVEIDGKTEDYLVMFKNETHNHPTEIEPFGGAATCLGGAIRDPLSGRAYVYQAMRITGCADPRATVEETLPGKLPQRKITRKAAAGYSSYGNQIGLATGMVNEIYHPRYVAKRMELGAVIAAVPKKNVVRETPAPGDIIILLGGRTGRDGCGGATGSSKAHTEESLSTCGAEVQKGNPPEERKIQRLFRKGEVARMILRCNDFGAGGVSVAIGELADGLKIDLDKVPKKYEGLDGTELAISESQERMAVVIKASDREKFMAEAHLENLEATEVAEVTEEKRLVMHWRGKKIVDLSRAFLDTNGAQKTTDVKITKGEFTDSCVEAKGNTTAEKWMNVLSDLNVCSQKGLSERFDASIGAGSVFMPFGGLHQQTPTQSMVAKIPVEGGESDTGTVMAHGYNPYMSEKSPFHGAVYAIVEAVTRAVAAGADYKDCYLTLQEFFQRLGTNPERWGVPMAALLGAYYAQKSLCLGAIGGKDSMSGSFNEIDVPPTLVAFAVSNIDTRKAVSNEIKKAGSKLYLVKATRDADNLPVFDELKANYEFIHSLINDGKVLSTYAISGGGICEAVTKMCFGNMIGAKLNADNYFAAEIGSVIIETTEEISGKNVVLLGETTADAKIVLADGEIDLAKAFANWSTPLANVFPEKVKLTGKAENISSDKKCVLVAKKSFAKPRVLIPVFPGSNCEYDSARAFERAGAEAEIFVLRNLSSKDIKESIEALKQKIDASQIVMIPGGFSGGDEPDGSGKFIATAFRNPYIKESVTNLLNNRDGLMLGICNGFQALIKLGLVPFGEIRDMDNTCPTLTYNTIGRHMSSLIQTRICSTMSPWFSSVNVGDVHTVAISHGEGRFVADEETVKRLIANGQVATQYVGLDGNASMEMPYNPNGSVMAIEGITSPDGRVLGKMAHSERIGRNVYKNVPGAKDQQIFESGVKYYR